MFTGADFVVVGAGIYGAVVAERLAAIGKRVCVVDKRRHAGGNCFDETDSETGILVHKYGPHIFHTGNARVLEYIGRFTEFNRYSHKVLAMYRGRAYPLPFNLETINRFYDINLSPPEVAAFMAGELSGPAAAGPAKNMEEKAIGLVGKRLYEAFIRDYTIKQWGRNPRDLPGDIITRIPVRDNYHDNYYNDAFTGMPVNGYAVIFKKMLAGDNITFLPETNYFDIRNLIPSGARIVFTGPIDSYFGYRHGRLAYRKVSFVREVHPVPDRQGTSVVNYPEPDFEYTRICEPRHFYREKWDDYSPDSTVTYKEIPSSDDGSDPYYPVRDKDNMEIYRKYREEADRQSRVVFGGRLGEYKYYDMDATMAAALALAERLSS